MQYIAADLAEAKSLLLSRESLLVTTQHLKSRLAVFREVATATQWMRLEEAPTPALQRLNGSIARAGEVLRRAQDELLQQLEAAEARYAAEGSRLKGVTLNLLEHGLATRLGDPYACPDGKVIVLEGASLGWVRRSQDCPQLVLRGPVLRADGTYGQTRTVEVPLRGPVHTECEQEPAELAL